MTTMTSTVSDLLFLARQPERAGISFRRSHEERAIPRVGGSSSCCKRERIQSVCSVLLNASVDVWYAKTRKPLEISSQSLCYRILPSSNDDALLALAVIRDYIINCSQKGVNACVCSRLEHSSFY